MDILTTPDRLDIAHDVHGSDNDLVLVHGITESSASWDPLLERLAADHRVIRIDLRGHGASAAADDYGLGAMAADVSAVLDHVGVDRPLLVGHSLGGFVVSVVAAARDVRGVVNVDQPLALAAFKDLLAPAEPMLRGEAFPAVITGMFDGYMAALDVAEQARLSQLRRPDQAAVLGIWDPVFTQDVEELDALVRDLVGGIEAPYLSIHGDDPGPDYRAWLSTVVPQAEIEVWDDSGHYPHLAHPDRFVARLVTATG